MAVDTILIRKAQIIEKCLLRIQEEVGDDIGLFKSNQTKQDSVLLNLERACQATIDMAMRIVRIKRLGVPADAREAFDLIKDKGMIPPATSTKMVSMVGFRNTAVHDYQGLNLEIVQSIIQNHLSDFKEFVSACLSIS